MMKVNNSEICNSEICNLLVYSSLIFITNIFTCFYKEYNIYGVLFICLVITSFIIHSNNNIYTNLLR